MPVAVSLCYPLTDPLSHWLDAGRGVARSGAARDTGRGLSLPDSRQRFAAAFPGTSG